MRRIAGLHPLAWLVPVAFVVVQLATIAVSAWRWLAG